MELKARKKIQLPQLPARVRRKSQEKPAKPDKADTYPHMITIRCNTMLYDTIQNMLTTAHTAQDFTYTSIADVLRAALGAYQQGMALTELEEKGEKLMTTIRVDRHTRDFYASLPERMRTKILERTIRTFLKQQR